MQKIIKTTIITTTAITLLWSIVGQTFIPVCANLSIVLIIALLND